jgi:anti-sigma B factor antagonist
MDVEVVDRPACRIVQPSGQLDIETAPRLTATLDELIEAGELRIVIDLGRLTFCDSIGLSTLVVAHRSCVRGGGYLHLARPSPFLLNLLTQIGIRDVIEVYASVEAACR